jgi:hypothetical protein
VTLDTRPKLMDHRTAATTQIYYRVTWARKREAIERLAPLTMDKEGRRVGFHSALVESERLPEEIGRIRVALGCCTWGSHPHRRPIGATSNARLY